MAAAAAVGVLMLRRQSAKYLQAMNYRLIATTDLRQQ